MNKGKIGVTTENIFPVIKKFLYSDQEIFLREIVSNAVDADQKLKTLAQSGEFKGDTSSLQVEVKFDKDKSTITVSDNGIGMTAEEIDKYINQIAFSGVTDFLDKYKDNANAIIGHFGLGFYSAFMVSDEVEIITRTYRPDGKAIRWSCKGDPEFELEDAERDGQGTDIIMHISDDQKEFLDMNKIESLLKKYCRFMPVPIVFGKKQEWKDGKMQDTDEDNVINTTDPIWAKAPSTLKDEDYKKFYRDLYPMHDEPLFWIHLNVDYPFNLTGILYFPHVSSNIELQRDKISLYCNQVFVTDQVEGIVPEFLTLLHGVIDSPDIPLNVSRSYLQSDANVKKISKYITKKVSDRLASIFKENRPGFEKKWDSLKLFINYGMLSQEDFYDKAKEYALLKDTEGKYFTYEEYAKLIKDSQTDKDGTTVYLYATDREAQYSFVKAAADKGYSVLLMDGELYAPLLSMLEQKIEKSRFVRVDSDTLDKLIAKADAATDAPLPDQDRQTLRDAFESVLPKMDKARIMCDVEPEGETASPVTLTQDEYMRRMKEISRYQPGMAFYGQMPDSYKLVINSSHPLIKSLLESMKQSCGDKLDAFDNELRGLRARKAAIEQKQKDKKPEEKTDEEKEILKSTNDEITKQEDSRRSAVAEAAKADSRYLRLSSLALLQCGLLKGESLSQFIAESVAAIQ